MPAHVVIDAGDLDVTSLRQLAAEMLFDLAAEEIESLARDDVLEPCLFSIRTISGVAKGFDDRAGHFDRLVRRAKRHSLGDRCERLLVRGSHSLAAADVNVVALDRAAVVNRHEAQVVGQHIDAVVFRQTDPDLEFAREIVRSVDRFFDRQEVGDIFFLPRLLIAQPEVEVRVRARTQVLGNLIRQVLDVATNRVAVDRGRAAHDVAVHVAASGQRGQLDLIDFTNRLAEVPLQDTVQLKPLPSRDSQRAVSKAVAQIQLRQKLSGGDFAAGNS